VFKKLLILIITAFVDMVGLLMILPLMPFYMPLPTPGSRIAWRLRAMTGRPT